MSTQDPQRRDLSQSEHRADRRSCPLRSSNTQASARPKTKKIRGVQKKKASRLSCGSARSPSAATTDTAGAADDESDVRPYWLFKTEPNVWGWEQQVNKGEEGEEWHGVRNLQARNNMRKMRVGDLGFFYHSNIGKEIVGVVEVCRESQPDSTTDDSRWDCVMVKAVRPFAQSVTLKTCKAQPGLETMVLVKNPRLSVQPVRPAEWDIVCKLGGVEP